MDAEKPEEAVDVAVKLKEVGTRCVSPFPVYSIEIKLGTDEF